MTTADRSVRLASALDTPAMGLIQAQTWAAAYADVLPADVLAELQPEVLAQEWRTAVVTPPSPRHRVLVALQLGQVVGFAAAGPAPDPDLDPATDAELPVLLVADGYRGAGHGSRLVQAVVDTIAPVGFTRLHTWVGAADAPLAGFLESTGWAADGATRTLDLAGDGVLLVEQRRLHTALPDAVA